MLNMHTYTNIYTLQGFPIYIIIRNWHAFQTMTTEIIKKCDLQCFLEVMIITTSIIKLSAQGIKIINIWTLHVSIFTKQLDCFIYYVSRSM